MGVSQGAMNRLGKGPHANMGASMDHSREAHKAITLYINQEVDLWKKYTSGFLRFTYLFTKYTLRFYCVSGSVSTMDRVKKETRFMEFVC